MNKQIFKAFLIKYAEIGIKGKNRYLFEDALVDHIRRALRDVELRQQGTRFEVRKTPGRIYVEVVDGAGRTMTGMDREHIPIEFDEVVDKLQKIFGIVGICPMVTLEDAGIEKLRQDVAAYFGEMYEDRAMTFKVNTRRERKNYPLNSMEVNPELGEALLEAYPELQVDVHSPQKMVDVEIRDHIYLFSEILPGPGGLPVGVGGKGMLLLSGGIDSPVAGYMIAKRGLAIDAVYFHAPPYTSDRAKQKVVDLAKLIAPYTGPIRLHIINFTDIQLQIYEKCPHDELTIIMRRYMMRIAEHLARECGALGLITGESLGQVASQTLGSLVATNEVCELPVLRPLIGFDKQEIVEIAERIGTFETSILPYEDCCTIFVAKHPVTKPNVKIIRKHETHLDEVIEDLLARAYATDEVVEIG